jgi:hypothetical protein
MDRALRASCVFCEEGLAFFPVEICVFRVLHLRITDAGIQEQTVEQFLFFIYDRKHVLEFQLRVRLRWFLSVVEFRQNFAGGENVPCAQESIQRLEDIVNRAIVQVAGMLS